MDHDTHPAPSGSSTAGAVLCPFCDTELPPDLLKDRPRTPALAPSTMQRPATSPLAGVDTAGDASARPPITTASLKHSLDESEDAENSATSAIISSDDIRRWSQIAGVAVSIPVTPATPAGSGSSDANAAAYAAINAGVSKSATSSSAAASPAKVVPLIPPPPGGRTPSSSGRFGFFSRSKSKLGVEDDDSDDDNSNVGYARLAGPGSDDDDDGYESDKPFTPMKKDEPKECEEPKEPETKAADAGTKAVTVDTTSHPIPTLNVAPITPETPVDELKIILGEVLARVQLLTTSHTDLLSSHSTLLTSLKIARSNLVMAEANTEMLEDELKRLKVPSQPSSARSAAIPDTGVPRGSMDKAPDGRPRPSSVQLGGAASAAPAHKNANSSGGFGFWKKSGTATPTATAPGSPTEGGNSKSAAAAGDPREEEVRQLRAQLEHQSDELEALKSGKRAIEAELEGLSQALFEEANKMVSDERKRRAEVEDSLREVKDEREALRQTVKVLGGRVQTPLPGTPMGAPGSHEESTGSDALDAHYAALRRGIHHAVDGPSPAPSEDSGSGSENEKFEEADGGDYAEGRSRSDTVTTVKATANGSAAADSKTGLGTGLPVPKPAFADAEPNPWG